MKKKTKNNKLEKQEKNIKIIATLGKNGWKQIPEFFKNGADIFRINGSHIKSNEDLLKMINNSNIAMTKNHIDKSCMMYDTQGPEIRTVIEHGNISADVAYYTIKKNDLIIVHTNLSDKEIFFKKKDKLLKKNTKNSSKTITIHIGVNYSKFIDDVKKGDFLTMENRKIYAKVEEKNIKNGTISLRITEVNTSNGKFNLSSRRHINLLGKNVSQPILTESDKQYIKTSVLSGVKYYAISFVRDAEDIVNVRNLIYTILKNNKNNKEANTYSRCNRNCIEDIMIIAKIETRQGLDNINKIAKEADGVMIARGDLSSEIPMEEVPYAKEKIILTCKKYGKFSILATDVLEGLMYKNSPFLNDIDTIVSSLKLGVNSLMLSNETAACEHGEKAIKELKQHIIFFERNKQNR